MPIHFLVQLEPKLDSHERFREELLTVAKATRTEAGCLSMRVFESLREPVIFSIHSEWVDEAAFELHAEFPHTQRFLEAAEGLLRHPIHGLRAREMNSCPTG